MCESVHSYLSTQFLKRIFQQSKARLPHKWTLSVSAYKMKTIIIIWTGHQWEKLKPPATLRNGVFCKVNCFRLTSPRWWILFPHRFDDDNAMTGCRTGRDKTGKKIIYYARKNTRAKLTKKKTKKTSVALTAVRW